MITLTGNSSFNYFGNKCEIGDWSEIVKLLFVWCSFLVFRQQATLFENFRENSFNNDELTRDVITGTTSFLQAFRARVGMGSKGHDFEADVLQ